MSTLSLITNNTNLISDASKRIIRVGLTGSIGMGKSSIANSFKSLGFPVFDSDAVVHALYSKNGEAVPLLKSIVPTAIIDNTVDRKVLGELILSDKHDKLLLKQVENIVHPLVKQKRIEFTQHAIDNGHLFVIYDIPLLYETGQNTEVDYTIVVTASAETQKNRVLARPGMTEDRFISILSKQIPDVEKRKLADYIINTDYPEFSSAKAQLASILENILEKNVDLWMSYISETAILTTPVIQSSTSGTTTLPIPLQVTASTATSTAITATTTATATEIGHGSNGISIESTLQVKDEEAGDVLFDLKTHYDLVVFDLDDTLVPTW